MQPEDYTSIAGTVTSEISTGKNIISLGAESYAALDKSPRMSSGYISVDFRHDFEPVGQYKQSGIGFLIKATDEEYVSIKLDAEYTPGSTEEAPRVDWVVQTSAGGKWQNIAGTTMPKLSPNQDYNMKIAYHNNKLILALNDVIFYNAECAIITGEGFEGKLGKFGFGKRFGATNITVDAIEIKGVGLDADVEPEDPGIVYKKDYEDGDPGSWSNSAAGKVEDDGSGSNKVLRLKSPADGYFVDLDSPAITNGSVSFDFKLLNPGNGFAFGYRMVPGAASHQISKGLLLSYAPHIKDWILESASGWSDTPLGIGVPTPGTWNNFIFNFNGKKVEVYLNKVRMGEFDFEGVSGADVNAGQFGVRLRSGGGGAEAIIDNLVYTDKSTTPEKIKEYYNDYSEEVTGTWTNANTSIAADGLNKVLKINTEGKMALLDTDTDLNAGTYKLKVKTQQPNVAFAFASEDAESFVEYKDGGWVLSHGENEYNFIGQAQNIVPMKWNNVGISFKPGEVTLNVNGKESIAILAEGTSLGTGTLGIKTEGDVFIDDVTYTEKFLTFDEIVVNDDKLYYEEFYDLVTELNWTNFSPAQADGKITGSIASKTTAINDDVKALDNGVYQLKATADNNFGINAGNLYVYTKQNKDWYYRVGDGQETLIGTTKDIKNEETIVKILIVEKKATLYVDNKFVGDFTVTEFTKGSFGIYNPNETSLSISIDAIGVEEIRIYAQDYETYTPDWSVVSAQAGNTIEAVANDGAVEVTLKTVVLGVDNETPSMLDQKVSVDFKANVDDSMAGGRYGLVLLCSDSKNHIAVECDINGVWRVNSNGNEYKFGKTYSLAKDEIYRMNISIIDKNVSFEIVNSEGAKTDLGTVKVVNMTTIPGKLGLRSWYSAKTITLDNLRIEEVPTLPLLQLSAKIETLKKDGFEVQIDANIPRIISYKLGGKLMPTNSKENAEILINGTRYTPEVASVKLNGTAYEYTMNIDSIGVVVTAKIELLENNIVSLKITDVKENDDFLVRTISLGESNLGYTSSILKDATSAWTKSSGQWHGISEDIIEDLSLIEKSTTNGATIAMISANDIALSIENNVMSGGNKTIINQSCGTFVNSVALYNGDWTYRHLANPKAKTEELPWLKIVVTGEVNNDSKVDWQDGAVAYRRHILIKPFEADDMANNMMYIPFNFASQATDPFLNSLDTGKVLYNYSDGFGQMLLHKGYQDEGHDSAIPSYDDVGVRQGGVKDLKYLIKEGDKYNLKVGVHINATEYHLDANQLDYQNLYGATQKGPYNFPTGSVNMPGYDGLSKGWDWIDTTYYVDQEKDVLSGELERRFKSLVDLTTNEDGTGLDFFYIDVYTGNDYNAQKLLEMVNGMGVKVGTEFAGPLEPGSNFVHWGPDLGYPNTGNGSLVYRMIKNDQDLFVGNSLFKGQKIAVVSTWGDSKPDIDQGVKVFFNEVLPTKYMQHNGVLKVATDEIKFENDVISKRNSSTGKVELSKEGKIISTWKDTGTTTSPDERHTSESDLLIPWEWDNDGNVLSVTEGAKLYHWSPDGGSSTWELTDKFKAIEKFNLYELTQQGRKFVKEISTSNGSITIEDAGRNVPYVLYPSNVDAEDFVPAASDWGEGSPVKDFAFNSEKIDGNADWKSTDKNATIKTVPAKDGYSTSKEMTLSRLNKYLEIDGSGDTVYQDVTGLEPKTGYNLAVWTSTPKGRTSTLQVEVGGKTYTNTVSGIDGDHFSNFKYRGQNWQKITLNFDVPAGVTTAKVKLIASAGQGVVLYDDAKCWEHIVKEDWAKKEDYLVYEDFENVSQGFGIFEYGGGSFHSQLKETKSNAVVNPSDLKVGPLFSWVLNGRTSLKLAETDVGTLIKTNESGLKLQPNTKYEMSFEYTQEKGIVYDVIVSSRSGGTPLLTKTLELFPCDSNGSSKNVTVQFETDDKSDYQVIFKVKSASGGHTDIHAFILDDFRVKTIEEHEVDKTDLETLIEANKDTVNDNYTADSWGAFQTALADAKAVLAKADAAQTEVDNAKTDLQSAIDGLIEITPEPVEKLDTMLLEFMIDEADELVEDGALEGVMPIVVKNFNKALTEAKDLLAKAISDPTSVTQDEIDEATNYLIDMIQMLDFKADKAKLQKLIDQSAKYVKDNTLYSTATYTAFEKALNAAKAVMADETAFQEDIDKAWTDLAKGIAGLRKIPNKDALKELTNKAKSVDTSKYTVASANIFKAALANATSVLADKNATTEDVALAIAKLKSGTNNLQLLSDDGAGTDKGGSPKTGNVIPLTSGFVILCATVLMVLLRKKRKI